MSETSERGRSFEMKVAKMTRLKIDKAAQRNKGSHANWHRRSDIYTELPIHIEAKDHETLKPKEWFRQADEASGHKTPVLVFQMDSEVMAMLRYDDLLNLFVEIADLTAELEDLRRPIVDDGPAHLPPGFPVVSKKPYDPSMGEAIKIPRLIKTKEDAEEVVEKLHQSKTYTCKNGHLSDQYGKCLQRNCPFGRGYVKPKKTK